MLQVGAKDILKGLGVEDAVNPLVQFFDAGRLDAIINPAGNG